MSIMSERERRTRYPLPSEAIKTKTYWRRYNYYLKKGYLSAYANEKAIDDAEKVLRRARMRALKRLVK